jgi:hypothetical protein
MELPPQEPLPFISEPIPPSDTIPLAPTRSRKRIRPISSVWTPEEDALLSQLVDESPNWSKISAHFSGRTSKQVIAHWRKVADPQIVRGSWSCQEDQAIVGWVTAHGPAQWATLARQLPGRIAKQCRERWCNHLDPAIKRDSWTPEEDHVIVAAIQQFGNKWADIAKLLQGRTDNAVKNRWNSTLRKRNLEVDAGLIDQFLRQNQALLQMAPDQQQQFGDAKSGEDRLLPGTGQ